jgi:ATP-dependent DNA helicase UvrD/PcrA
MTIPYLEKLNPQQRHAVEHGGSALAEAGPLLIIAGAGSGKTNTLAHRVAHLIVNGADPHRVMLLTFSRRAAGEMIRRVERIVANVMRMQDDRHTGTNPRGYAREQVEAAPSSWIDPNPLRPVASLLAALS